MVIIYDHHIWSSYMNIIYDDHIWSSYMMIIHIYDDHFFLFIARTCIYVHVRAITVQNAMSNKPSLHTRATFREAQAIKSRSKCTKIIVSNATPLAHKFVPCLYVQFPIPLQSASANQIRRAAITWVQIKSERLRSNII